jgi:uronate dehydrogenase
MKKIVLTGAAGRLGSYLRAPLAKLAEQLVSTDIAPDIGKTLANETYMRADLADLNTIKTVLQGADMVVHFGAIGDEAPFEQLLGPNFIGAYNIWEAAFQNGVRRVVYASSIHAVGMYDKTDFIGTDVPHRPDTFYGLAKCFAEDLARLYWEKRKIEATSARALGTWLSYDDLIQLVECAINTPVTGFTIAYGVSNNDRVGVDNSKASFLGYRPKDNAEQFAAKILSETPVLDVNDKTHTCHGGVFAAVPLGESGVAHMKIVNDKKSN